ncbi:MAG TPA: DinB family protein [Verrucomicrobiae bacterium]|nr:DinB family protein [Verrucomicrobiae bacterium]
MTPAERRAAITRYAAGPARLRAALRRVPRAALHWRPAPGEWSAHEVVLHCADSESTAQVRLRYLLAERDPMIVGYNQEEWARALDYARRPLAPALATVAAVRANTVPLLRTLAEEGWSRSGRHTEIGAYTVEGWLGLYAEHLEIHARQIEANLAGWSAQRGPGQPRRKLERARAKARARSRR